MKISKKNQDPRQAEWDRAALLAMQTTSDHFKVGTGILSKDRSGTILAITLGPHGETQLLTAWNDGSVGLTTPVALN